jgi:Lon protease-like protein
MGDHVESFPLFPLGIVLLPGEVVPLHIFEDRYKLMIGECMDEERPFGVVWLSDDGLREVGCTADVTRLLERMDDGRMNILVEGHEPFRLLRRIEDLPYPAGDVELLDDEPRAAPVDTDVAVAARDRYAELVERVTDEPPEDDDLAALDAYGMAATIDFELAAKQKLLELRSEEERLRRVADMLATTMKRLDYAERAAEVARSNGRVPS